MDIAGPAAKANQLNRAIDVENLLQGTQAVAAIEIEVGRATRWLIQLKIEVFSGNILRSLLLAKWGTGNPVLIRVFFKLL
jgi:hypothetical protein